MKLLGDLYFHLGSFAESDLEAQNDELRARISELESRLGAVESQNSDSWLTEILRTLLAKALENPEQYNVTRDLIALLNYAGAVGVLADPGPTNVGLVEAFEQALLPRVEEAFEDQNRPLLEELLAVAGRYALTDLYDEATKVLEAWRE